MKLSASSRYWVQLLWLPVASCTSTGDRPAQSAIQSADFHRLTFHAVADKTGQSQAQAGSRVFTLLGPDDLTAPTRWQGPLRIDSPSGKSCEAALSIITDAYANASGDSAVVVSYSGSITSVDVISSDTCRPRSPTIKTVTQGVEVQGNQIRILPGCECPGGSKPCDCSAAQVYSFDAESKPVLNEELSKQLTRTVLHVEFLGRRKVFSPKTRDARLAEP